MNHIKEVSRMLIFTEVAKQGSFTTAAGVLGITKSGVSQHVKQLEESLGVQLLNRTTRGLTLTEVGKTFYKRCESIQNQISLALDELQEAENSPQGVLSITGPNSLESGVILPAIERIHQDFQLLRPRLITNDESLDLVQNHLDVAIHLGALKDSGYRAKRLGLLREVICASPAYLATHQPILKINDLHEHQWIATNWQRLEKGHCVEHPKEGTSELKLVPDIWVNALPAAAGLVEKSMGIALLPNVYVYPLFREGSLVPVLPQLQCDDWDWDIYALHPYQEAVPLKVRRFIEHVEACLNDSCAFFDNC